MEVVGGLVSASVPMAIFHKKMLSEIGKGSRTLPLTTDVVKKLKCLQEIAMSMEMLEVAFTEEDVRFHDMLLRGACTSMKALAMCTRKAFSDLVLWLKKSSSKRGSKGKGSKSAAASAAGSSAKAKKALTSRMADIQKVVKITKCHAIFAFKGSLITMPRSFDNPEECKSKVLAPVRGSGDVLAYDPLTGMTPFLVHDGDKLVEKALAELEWRRHLALFKCTYRNTARAKARGFNTARLEQIPGLNDALRQELRALCPHAVIGPFDRMVTKSEHTSRDLLKFKTETDGMQLCAMTEVVDNSTHLRCVRFFLHARKLYILVHPRASSPT